MILAVKQSEGEVGVLKECWMLSQEKLVSLEDYLPRMNVRFLLADCFQLMLWFGQESSYCQISDWENTFDV